MDTRIPEGPAPGATSGSAPSAPLNRRTKPVVWVVSAIVIVTLAAVGVVAFRHYERIGAARDLITRAESALQGVEDELLLVDAAVQTDVSSEIATSSAEASAVVGAVREQAQLASSLVASAVADLPEADLAYAAALKESADARVEMMAHAPAILDAGHRAAKAIALVDAAVAEITAAETMTAQAATEFNKHTAVSVKASSQYTTQAEERFTAARNDFANASAILPEADFGAFVAYLDAKLSLAVSAKEIDALWLAGKIEESNTKLTVYNKRDAGVVAMAKALPASARDPIANAYEAITAESRAAYVEARERARAAGEQVGAIRAQSS